MSPRPPLRVLVVGSSVTYMVVPPRADASDGTYAQHLRRMLAERGHPAQVTLRSRWYGRVDEFLRDFEAGIRDPMPDVVVLDVGEASCHPRVLPTTIARHFLTWDRTSRPGARVYRRQVAVRLWRVLRTVQRLGSRHAPLALSRLSPQRFRHDTGRLLALVRTETGAAVVVLGVEPAGTRAEYWMPGLDERAAHYDRLLQQLVRHADDPGVTYLSRAVDTAGVPVDELLPDGLHRTAAGHRLLAERLVDAVLEVAAHARTAWPGNQPDGEVAR